MINKVLPLLNEFLPSALAIKGLSKVDPRISNFLTGALSAGYGADAAIDFLRDRLSTTAQKSERRRLESRVERGTARPDEMAGLNRIETSEQVPRLAANLATGAAGLAGGLLGARAGAKGKEVSEAGIPVQPSSSAHIRSQREHGPFEQGPEQGVMGPLREGHDPRYAMGPNPQPQHPQHPKGEREKALQAHSEMNKKKRLIDKLIEEFEQEYGDQGVLQGPQATRQAPTVQPAQSMSPQMQALISAMNRIKRG